MTPATSTVPQKSSHRDELLMQQSLVFSDTLKDLKGLRKQLYSAAEYFEITYIKEEQKEIVEDTLKDYVVKALVNTVDHLGSVASKVNNFLDDKLGEISGLDLRLSCLEQRLRTCQDFVNLGGLSQQSLVLEELKHHKRYLFPVKQTRNDIARTGVESHQTRMPASARLDSHQFKSSGIVPLHVQTTAEAPSEPVRDEFYTLRSPQPSPRKSPKLFTSFSMNQRQENRSTSPRRFSLLRSGSVMHRSSSPSHSNAKKRWPSEPRRTVSLAEREKVKDMEQYSSKSKRLFKAILSLRKSKKDATVYKLLDEN